MKLQKKFQQEAKTTVWKIRLKDTKKIFIATTYFFSIVSDYSDGQNFSRWVHDAEEKVNELHVYISQDPRQLICNINASWSYCSSWTFSKYFNTLPYVPECVTRRFGPIAKLNPKLQNFNLPHSKTKFSYLK